MSLIKKVLLGFAGFLLLLVLLGLALPSSTSVERQALVPAPRAAVFTVLNGFRHFNAWSPWAALDPNAKFSYTGPVQGVGAGMQWSGAPEIGSGTQEITASTPYESVVLKLVFSDWGGGPVQSQFLLADGASGGTEVRWRFETQHGANLLGRYFGLLMARYIAADYDAGLARLAAYVQTLPHADLSALEISRVDWPETQIAYVRTSSMPNDRALGVSQSVAYGQVQGFLSKQSLQPSGPPLALFESAEQALLRFDAAIPVAGAVEGAGDPPVQMGRIAAGPMLKMVVYGPRSELAAARTALQSYLVASGYLASGRLMEQYVGPSETHIYQAVQ